MKSKPKILCINDDGIHAPGLHYLWEAAASLADLTIVAPSQERSGAGLSLTIKVPLYMNRVDWPDNTPAWSVSGTPTDCVKMALSVILDEYPDFIISGINPGSNAGRNILYSGTIGGVIEAVFRGIPGIAFSCYDPYDPPFEEGLPFIPHIIEQLVASPPPNGTFYNVTFPPRSAGSIRGILCAHQGMAYWGETPEKRLHHPSKKPYYWLGGVEQKFPEDEGSDVTLAKQGYITVTPVQVNDLTNYNHMHLLHDACESIDKTIHNASMS